MMALNRPCFIIVSPGFPVSENDTTCLPAQQQFVRALNRNFPHLQILIVTLFHPDHDRMYQWFGNTVLSMGGRSYGKLLRPLLWRRAVKEGIIGAVGLRIEGVLSLWCSDSAWVGKQLAKRLGVSHKCWILGQDARVGNWFVRLVRPAAYNLIALSPFLAAEFEKNYGVRPAHLVRNSVDIHNSAPVAETRDIDILGVGSLTTLKQWHVLTEVVARLRESLPSIKVWLAGKGPEAEHIRKEIARRHLDGNITLAGEVEHRDVLALMQRVKILLHPSSYEGYSGACLEALHAGCHVVSFTKAEDHPVRHWHVLRDEKEMTATCLEICNTRLTFPASLYSVPTKLQAI
ncbi:MAG: glycosyltransferase [Bacteroidia bacterium]|nr:glycosyltransferase [Bacteroidia bacterium]